MDYKNFSIRILSSLLFILVYFILYFNLPDQLIYFVTLIYFIIFLEVIIYFKKLKFFLITYIFISYFFVFIYFLFDFNFYEFTLVIFCISCFDSFCYLSGKIFGKNKIFHKISPNKTYEGLLGGIIITNLLSFIIYFNFNIYEMNSNFNLIFLTNIIILFSFFGDLTQSYFKRFNNLKDSSNLIPGHGGFFDRFDSFILVIIPLSIINFFFK